MIQKKKWGIKRTSCNTHLSLRMQSVSKKKTKTKKGVIIKATISWGNVKPGNLLL